MTPGSTDRWTAKARSELVADIVAGRLDVDQASAEHDLPRETVEEWVEDFLLATRRAVDKRMRGLLSKRGIETSDDGETRGEFSGRIEEHPVVELVQTLQMNEKTGVVRLRSHHGVARVFLDAGDIVAAQWGALEGQDALVRALRLERGAFVVEYREHNRERQISGPGQTTLLEAIRQVDEAKRLLASLPPEDQVVEKDPGMDTAELSERERDVLAMFDGVRCIADALGRSELPDAEVLPAMVTLFDKGHLTPVEANRVSLETDRFSSDLDVVSAVLPKAVIGTGPQQVRPGAQSRATGSRGRLWAGLGVGAGLVVGVLAVTGAFGTSADDAAARPSTTASGSSGDAPEAPPKEPAPEVHASGEAPPAESSDSGTEVEPTPPVRTSCPEGTVKIEGGSFFQGLETDNAYLRVAEPAHQVTLPAYCMDVFEVSVGEYRECSNAGECERLRTHVTYPRGEQVRAAWLEDRETVKPLCNANREGVDDDPANCVTWAQADAYCRFSGKRLPTESEWEFAARGREGRSRPWGDGAPDETKGNFCDKSCRKWRKKAEFLQTRNLVVGDDGYVGTAPRGALEGDVTPEGVHDLAGNVSEWTADVFSKYTADGTDAPEPAGRRVTRGGDFFSYASVSINAAFRRPLPPTTHSPVLGFRCVADLDG